MTTYIRAAGSHAAERVRPEPGSADEARYEELVADSSSGWRRVEEEVEAAVSASNPDKRTRTRRPSNGKTPGGLDG